MAQASNPVSTSLWDPGSPSEPGSSPEVDPPAVEDRRSGKKKDTIYLRPDADMLLRQIQLARYEITGRRPHLSELIEEAIHELPISPSGLSGN